MLVLYAKFFNVSADYIIGLTQNPTPNWTIKNNININYGNVNMN